MTIYTIAKTVDITFFGLIPPESPFSYSLLTSLVIQLADTKFTAFERNKRNPFAGEATDIAIASANRWLGKAYEWESLANLLYA